MTVNENQQYSATPGTPQTPTKALVATVLTAVTVFVSAWIADDNGASTQEILSWIISALVSAGVVGYPTYQVKNRAKAVVGGR
jgi:predicted benzoate:H+ symporter BenE